MIKGILEGQDDLVFRPSVRPPACSGGVHIRGRKTSQSFGEAFRKINALHVIRFDEWLPSILGPNTLGAYSRYDSKIDATVLNEFSAAAMRFGHDLVGDDIEFLDNEGSQLQECPEVSFSEAFFNPTLVKKCGIASILK